MDASRTIATAGRPRRLLVDLQAEPVGVDTEECRLSWWVPGTGSQQQERFQVQIAASVPELETGSTVWDSGERSEQQSAGVLVSGLALPASSVLWWRVRTWSVESERPSAWSDPHRLVTAADPGGWPAEGVWAPGAGDDGLASWALLRVEEHLPEGEVLAAMLEVSALSPEGARQYVAKTWVNGEVAGRSSVRATGDEARYHTHDVTASVRAGQSNALAALCWAEDGRSVTARLTVTYRDGRTHVVTSSPRWRALDGSAMLPGTDTIEGGWYRAPRECWDMRHEPAGWTLPGFDDTGWRPAVPRPNDRQVRPAVVDLEQHEARPARVERRGPDGWFIDLGAEIVGGLRLEIDAPETLTMGVVLGEELRADGSILSPLRTGNVYEETWTLRPGPQVVEHWGFRGFRYVEVVGCPLDLTSALTAFALHAPVESEEQARGAFACSDPDLERVWDLCRRTIEVTGSDVYVDTAVRERGPYEGDMWVNQLSQYAVGGGWALARYSGEYLTRRPTWPSEYQLMPVLCGWADYLATGDDRQLRSDYAHWRRSTFAHELDALGLVRRDNPGTGWGADLVDWPPTYRDGHVFGDVNTVLNAFQWAAYEALARVAEVLGETDDHALCTARAATTRAAITEHLLDRDRARYRDGEGIEHSSQHATATPVALGLAPTEDLAALGRTLVAQGVRTSIYAVQLLLDALYLAGEDEAGRAVMASREAPGWIDVMDRPGATLTPEAWDPELKPNMTFSHAWGTAPANVIARHLVGVQVVEPGAARGRDPPAAGRAVVVRRGRPDDPRSGRGRDGAGRRRPPSHGPSPPERGRHTSGAEELGRAGRGAAGRPVRSGHDGAGAAGHRLIDPPARRVGRRRGPVEISSPAARGGPDVSTDGRMGTARGWHEIGPRRRARSIGRHRQKTADVSGRAYRHPGPFSVDTAPRRSVVNERTAMLRSLPTRAGHRSYTATPMTQLDALFPQAPVQIHAKLDNLQVSGSVKERTAVALLDGLARDGLLQPGGTVVESTSGNLGVALARLCAISSYTFVAVVDERANVAACRAMQAYGARLERVPTPPDGNRLAARVRRVRELLETIAGAVTTNQYGNPDSPAVHAASTYPEIVSDLGGPPTHLYAATSTTGTVLGLQQAAAAAGHDVELVAVDAAGSALFGGTPGERLLPGLGAGFETDLSLDARPDVVHRIPEADMVVGCRLLARREGILAGASTGAIVAAIGRDLARLPDDSRVAMIVHDSGMAYLPTVYDDEWVDEQFGPGPREALDQDEPNPFA